MQNFTWKESFFVEVCTDQLASAQVLKEHIFYFAGCVSAYIMSEFGHQCNISFVDICALNFSLQ